jgi:hypothetical protein
MSWLNGRRQLMLTVLMRDEYWSGRVVPSPNCRIDEHGRHEEMTKACRIRSVSTSRSVFRHRHSLLSSNNHDKYCLLLAPSLLTPPTISRSIPFT